MKQMKKLFALTIMAVGFSTVAFAQSTATATTTAKVVGPISITKNVDLNFGALSVTATAGTLVLAPAGTTSVTGGVSTQGGALAAASFAVAGDASATYSITLPGSITLSDGGAPAETMTVGTFTSSPSGTGTLDASGAQTLTVGATLSVGASQAAGTYTNTTDLDVTVGYN